MSKMDVWAHKEEELMRGGNRERGVLIGHHWIYIYRCVDRYHVLLRWLYRC